MYNITGNDPESSSITIRPATPDDAEALRRLAQRDGQAVPAGDVLLAAVGGEVRAAISLASGGVIADPFHRTAELVALLRQHGPQPRGKTRPTGSASLSPQPVG